MTQPIFMVGARGCGKTTVGQLLALTLGYEFTDTDEMLLRSTGQSVAQIVEREGWAGFRAKESEVLKRVTGVCKVIATGGGIVLAAANRQFMQSHGTVIYLHAHADVLARRLEAFPQDDQRPSLTGRPIVEEIAEVLLARETLYQDAAHHVFDAAVSPDGVVAAIVRQLQPQCQLGCSRP
ncbi:shikimate kinase AroL [Acerihabitans sp. TG2]|uniref:shikimate kinase AroL n=1 Tax=Acerihabitans sp. TG2 TaxID=3096008 RepID=UPI002B224A23|nr:shikimate kinase AroL [Acerihabitans sp. TG2]MEA9390760.1 shikimate kinase AroL [Acerihabitans sp. TG2]